MNHLRRLASSGPLWISAAAAVLGLAAQAGRWSVVLDVAAHFAPIWFAFGALGLALSVATTRGPQRQRGVGLALIGMVASGALIAPELRAPAPSGQASGPVLKLVQFNIWQANRDPQATLRWILAQNADVVVVEEAIGRAAPIAQALMRAYPNWSSCEMPLPCSVMVFSRLPRLAAGDRDGPPTAWALYRWRDREVMVAGVHMFWPIPPGFQRFQMRRAAAFMSAQPQANAILAGDFNAAPWSFAVKRMDRTTGLERRTHGLMTWPAAPVSALNIPVLAPLLPIDQVYAGAGWRTVSVVRGPKLGSDHYPVVVTLAPR